jgi:glycerol-3-phosphate dehydrogenase
MISVTGGKLTTYRRMAVDAVDAVVEELGRGGRSHTRRLRLHGAHGFDALTPDAAPRLGLDAATLAHLAGRFGSDARVIAAMLGNEPELGERIAPDLPYLWAEAVYAVRHEMAGTVEDVVARRLPLRWLDDAAADAAAPRVKELLASG